MRIPYWLKNLWGTPYTRERLWESMWMGALAVLMGIGLYTLIMVGVSIVLATPVYFLWNWLMPEIFDLKAITFWQAFGLNLLVGILLSPKFTFRQ